MITKLQNPIAVAGLGVLLSVGLGAALSWKVLSVAIAELPVATPAEEEPTELKRRGWDFWTIEMDNLANELKEERERLRHQADLLDQRAARIAAEEKAFAKVRADVEALRQQIAEHVIEIKSDESRNLRSLAAAYTNLTPRAAVAILREMDDTTAVKILSLMKPDVVGAIFEEMSRGGTPEEPLAKRAAQLSEKLRLMKAMKPAN